MSTIDIEEPTKAEKEPTKAEKEPTKSDKEPTKSVKEPTKAEKEPTKSEKESTKSEKESTKFVKEPKKIAKEPYQFVKWPTRNAKKGNKGPLKVVLYKLKSEDGQLFLVDRASIKYSSYINQRFIDFGYNDRNVDTKDPIDVPFHSSIVALIIKWLNHHQFSIPKDPKIRYPQFDEWDKSYFKMESGALFALLNASHALGIEDLMNMGCAAAAELIRGKNCEEIRKIYGIRSDEEEMENALANGGEGSSTTKFTYD